MRRHTLTAAILLTTAAALTSCAAAPADNTPPAAHVDTTPQTTPDGTDDPAPATTSPAQAIRSWYDNNGKTQINTVAGDLGTVTKSLTTAAANTDADHLSKLGDDCATLTSDIESQAGETPVPDKKARDEWRLALQHLRKAAQLCTEGALSQDVDKINQMNAELTIGTKHIGAVAKRIGQVKDES